MARPAEMRVVILRVSPMDAPQQDGERILALRDGDQMHVVGHHAPAQDAGVRVLHVLPHKVEVRRAVLVGGKRLAPVNSALGDVAGQAGDYTAVATWHLLKQCANRSGSLGKMTQFRLSLF